jgi:hypothetical protein
LWRAQWDAEREEQITEDNDPLWSVIADAIDFTDPEIWKSNAFARLRDRLIPHVEWAIAQLENNAAHFRCGPAADIPGGSITRSVVMKICHRSRPKSSPR